MNKEKYFISVASKQIAQTPFENNNDFTIYATQGEVSMLRRKMDKMYEADLDSFWRSHVPIVPYHNDVPNDMYDAGITEAFQMVYDLGDSETKTHIESMGILNGRTM